LNEIEYKTFLNEIEYKTFLNEIEYKTFLNEIEYKTLLFLVIIYFLHNFNTKQYFQEIISYNTYTKIISKRKFLEN
jgi:hypothetical protein